MVSAKVGDTVLVHYTGKLKDGTIFDSSRDREPISICIGSGKLLPSFERALVGMSPGESKVETIPSEHAYGPHKPEMVVEVNRHSVFSGTDVEVGQQVSRTSSAGKTIELTVVGIHKSKVTLDANHTLAGKDLIFDIDLIQVVE
ncbi:MAG: peptidylprolyl isomerase [Synechococcus sp.]